VKQGKLIETSNWDPVELELHMISGEKVLDSWHWSSKPGGPYLALSRILGREAVIFPQLYYLSSSLSSIKHDVLIYV
jgi:hypothetical protein